MTFKQAWDLVKKTIAAWVDDFAPSMGAALSYYTMFSLAPLLVIVIAVAGLVFGQDAAQGQILAQLRGLMGEEGALAVEGLLKSASDPNKSGIATVVGVFTLLLGATTVFGELQSALDRIWRSPAVAKGGGLWKLLRGRVLSFGMILGIGFLLMVSLAVSAALAALGKWWGPWFGNWEVLLQALNFVVSFAVTTLLFAMIYKILPRVRIGWKDVWIGAAVTALLFTIGKFLIGLYLGKSAVTSAFGAAGSIVVVLVWVYYSAQIFLLGAEFTWVYAYRHGTRAGQPEAAPPPTIPTKSEAAAASPSSMAPATRGQGETASPKRARDETKAHSLVGRGFDLIFSHRYVPVAVVTLGALIAGLLSRKPEPHSLDRDDA